ncbi:hypothetical protein [Pyxidicoccus trucidator]|uniref:hypothetical protein n=1 Tax=Pyxidicoccus trucidator TaxID=2709662 RepID=UPI0013D8F598|nr:hypothetical protein [Pyxidicoccus trucidator]
MARATRTDIEMKPSFGVGGVALLATLLLGSGCTKNVEAAPRAPSTDNVSQYYPLAVGNRWTYRLNRIASKQVTVEVLKEEDGYFHDNQRGQLAVDSYGLRDAKRYLLRGPLQVGHSWTNVVSVSSTERYRILEVGVPCEAPAGAFQGCVQVEARNRMDANATMVNTMTFAPGVGIVRVDISVESKEGQRTPQVLMELTGWQLASGEGRVPPAPEATPAG